MVQVALFAVGDEFLCHDPGFFSLGQSRGDFLVDDQLGHQST
jgi:hypothetical protein